MKLTKTEIIAELQYEYMRPERDADMYLKAITMRDTSNKSNIVITDEYLLNQLKTAKEIEKVEDMRLFINNIICDLEVRMGEGK